MSKLIVSNWTTPDGFIAGSSGEMDWILGDEEMGAYELGLVGAAETMVFGGKTYREFSAYWPKVPANPQSNPFEQAFAEKINQLKKMVFSRTMTEPLWDRTTYYDAIDPAEIEKLKANAKSNLVMYGSSSIVAQLTKHRLIDEYHVIVHPLLLGEGLPYFNNLGMKTQLRRLECTPLDSGATILTFGLA